MMKKTSMILMIEMVKIVIVRLNTEKVLLLWTAWSNSQNYQVCTSDNPLFIFRGWWWRKWWWWNFFFSFLLQHVDLLNMTAAVAAMDSLKQHLKSSSLPVRQSTFWLWWNNFDGDCVFLQFVDLMEMPAGSPSPSVIWLRNGVLIDSDYTRWIKWS